MAFKGESDDIRDSLSYKLKKLLDVEAREVLCTDPFVPDPGLVPLDEAVRKADIIVLGAPHSAYHDLEIPPGKIVIDIWNFWPERRREARAARGGGCGRREALMKVLVTGSAGFICGYLIEELLQAGYDVVGLDNFSKYGRVEKSYDKHPHYRFVEGDCKNIDLLKELLSDCDHFVACAAMIGGISYFHEFAYDLLAENERITAASFDAALHAHKHGQAAEDHRDVVQHGLREHHGVPDSRGRAATLSAAALDLRLPEAGDRVLRARARGSSTSCRTPSCGRSTASASARSALCTITTS